MESREFYDERSPDTASGLFDLNQWPPRLRAGLVSRANRQLMLLAGSPQMSLDANGFARIPEPDKGPNPQWSMAAVEAHRAMEIAVGTIIPVLVRVERVYRFNFATFQPRDWTTLASVFAQMPGWKGPKPYPHWFGTKDSLPPVLWGKIEVNGLRIRGEIQRGRWNGWDTWLRRNMYEFPLQ